MNLRAAYRLPIFLAAIWMVASTAIARDAGFPGLTEVASSVYAVIGRTEEPAPSNRGVVGNTGVIVAEDGVILIGTGTSAFHAASLLDNIRRTIGKPVILAINTHQNPAFVFGNGTLVQQRVPILAHEDVDALIAQRCMRCLKLLQAALGVEAMLGTEVVRPTTTIRDSVTLAAGGRVLDILYYGQTSAPGSIAVFDRESGVLFGGGMVSIERIPDTKDAEFSSWRQALVNFRELNPKKIVPGEGPVIAPGRLRELDDYLVALNDTVKSIVKRRIGLSDASAAAPLARFASWGLYPSMHRKNVEQLYLRLEREAFSSN